MVVQDPHRAVRYHSRLGFTSQQRELLDIVQGHTLRWLVEIFQPHYDSSKPLSLTAA
jgi:hypothetical protein